MHGCLSTISTDTSRFSDGVQVQGQLAQQHNTMKCTFSCSISDVATSLILSAVAETYGGQMQSAPDKSIFIITKDSVRIDILTLRRCQHPRAIFGDHLNGVRLRKRFTPIHRCFMGMSDRPNDGPHVFCPRRGCKALLSHALLSFCLEGRRSVGRRVLTLACKVSSKL